jgi:hypothetical protein
LCLVTERRHERKLQCMYRSVGTVQTVWWRSSGRNMSSSRQNKIIYCVWLKPDKVCCLSVTKCRQYPGRHRSCPDRDSNPALFEHNSCVKATPGCWDAVQSVSRVLQLQQKCCYERLQHGYQTARCHNAEDKHVTRIWAGPTSYLSWGTTVATERNETSVWRNNEQYPVTTDCRTPNRVQ